MTAIAPPAIGQSPAAPLDAKRQDAPLTEPLILFLVVASLMTIGILMVYSASRTASPGGDTWYFAKHLVFVPVALAAMAFGASVPYGRLNRRWIAYLVLGSAVVLLALVLVLGEERNHARRWFSLPLGPLRLSFQPSEYAKFALVIFLAWFFSRPCAPSGGWLSRLKFLTWYFRRPQGDPCSLLTGFLPPIIVIGIVGVLIVKEDFGTAALVGLVAMLLCVVAGWRWWYPLLLIVPGLAGLYRFVWMVDYRRERLEIWMDPWKYFDGKGWHVCQSLMGIGSGDFFGAGLGAGIQKLYIPEITTDFIFAAICEEMGLLGGLLVIGLFGVLIWRAGRIVSRAPDRFGFLLASGILLVIGLQAVLNMGVVTGALPAKGISLPFISYGGSCLVMMSFAVGLLISISRGRGAASQPQPAAAASGPLVRMVPAGTSPVPVAASAAPTVVTAAVAVPGAGGSAASAATPPGGATNKEQTGHA